MVLGIRVGIAYILCTHLTSVRCWLDGGGGRGTQKKETFIRRVRVASATMLLLARRLVIGCNGSWRGWQCLWRLCPFGLSEHQRICSHSCGRDAMGTYKSYHKV